jgi:hypothetical protein
MTRSRVAAAALLLALLLDATLSACADGGERELNDAAACPGSSCTDDTRGRVDAIAGLDGVTEVVEVAREYGLDRGSYRTATVRVDATGGRSLRDVGLAVMRALEAWPEHADGGATVLVEPDGADPVTFLLDGEWVCRQPVGMRVACTAENSWTLDGEPISP